jgi:hypothetical protein
VGDDAKLYQLPKSGLRFSGTTLSRHEGDALVADHSLSDLTEVVLRSRRTGVDFFLSFLFAGLFAGSVAGLYFWGVRAGSVPGWVVCGLAAFLTFLMLIVSLTARSAVLVLRGKAGEVSYPIIEERPVAEAFFSEIREHAQAQRLMIGFRVDR